MASKKKTPKKSDFFKAAETFVKSTPTALIGQGTATKLVVQCGDRTLTFQEEDDCISCDGGGDGIAAAKLPLFGLSPTCQAECANVGTMLQFFHRQERVARGDLTPEVLGGNGKDFEELLMSYAKILARQGILTMGRYGTMVTLVEKEWRPVPSYPDFEGVLADGRQFLIEAKVCSSMSLRMQNVFIKHKQVRHMLNRSKFNVPAFVAVHFNARRGVTFYEPSHTYAVPVKYPDAGGWPVWQQFAECKDKNKEFPALTREIAAEIGVSIRWFVPPRAKTLFPDIKPVLLPDHG